MSRLGVRSIPFVITFLASTGFTLVRSAESGEVEVQIEKAIFQTINVGVPLYNGGDAAGCYRIYQGSLIALDSVLGDRPDLQATIHQGLKASATLRTYEERAVALRSALDSVRAGLLPQVTSGSLWSRLGGEAAVRAIAHDFVIKAAIDPKVDFTRGGKYPLDADGVKHIEGLLVQQISSVTGGPLKYTGRDMKPVHAGMAITEAQFNAIAGDLVAVLKSHRVKQSDIDELLDIIATTKDAIVENPGDVPPSAAVPPAPPAPGVPVDPTSLWARLGGEPAVRAVVHDFVIRAADDPKVDFTRGGKYPLDADGVKHIEGLLVQQISSVSGGPLKYTGRDMKPVHAGMAITEAQFNAIAGDLVTVLKIYRVPQPEINELLGIIATTKDAIVEEAK